MPVGLKPIHSIISIAVLLIIRWPYFRIQWYLERPPFLPRTNILELKRARLTVNICIILNAQEYLRYSRGTTFSQMVQLNISQIFFSKIEVQMTVERK